MYPVDIIHLLWHGFDVIKGPRVGPIAKNVSDKKFSLICIFAF